MVLHCACNETIDCPLLLCHNLLSPPFPLSLPLSSPFLSILSLITPHLLSIPIIPFSFAGLFQLFLVLPFYISRTLPTMFALRFARPASSLVRPFSSSSVVHRVPSIRDITPDSASEFDLRQKEFRENLDMARKKKEQQESQSVDTTTSASASFSASSREYNAAPAAPSRSDVSDQYRAVLDAAENLDQQGLSLLLSHRALGEQSEAGESTKRGPLSSLIYGTKEARQHEHDIERSFSEVLARGKYVHSIVFHDVKPDKVPEYVEAVGQWYPRIASMEENKVNLVGSWRTQVGDNDTFGT